MERDRPGHGVISLWHPGAVRFLILILSLALGLAISNSSSHAAEPPAWTVDFSLPAGKLRPLHGGNNGPLGSGETVDLTAFHRELNIPFVRLHDTAWPYPDIVDIHAIFPDFQADPASPASYRFGPTDDYLRAITNAGSRIVYRLGESIEHAKRKRYVHPPADPEKWAAICEGIIRHYNEGWADGLRLGIDYWEIWNEPENAPAMWTGTADQFYRLYSVTAKRLKARWPQLKIGGPSLGYQGEFKASGLQPSLFLNNFIEHLRKEAAPLDFFSWHLYTSDPGEPTRRAAAVRQYLDAMGFRKTESHLNEWNYLPDSDWSPMLSRDGTRRETWYARQGGMEGAVFAASVLISLQEAPVDVANFYSSDNSPFGLFTLHGARKKTFFAFKAFQEVASIEMCCKATGVSPVLAAWNKTSNRGTILVVAPEKQAPTNTLLVRGMTSQNQFAVTLRILDESRNLDSTEVHRAHGATLEVQIPSTRPGIFLIELSKAVEKH